MVRTTLVLVAAVASIALGHGAVLLTNPDSPKSAMKTGKVASGQKLDSNFWGNTDGETYGNHKGRFFRPQVSSTFSLIKLNNVNVTFLDNTNLRGYDGADMATLGKYKVETRMGMIEHCNSRNFDDVDGILGFGWADQKRSAALLKTLTQAERPGWDITSQPFAGDGSPMPRKFAFTANNDLGELHLGGYDPAVVDGDLVMMPMTGTNVYGIDIHSITYGGVELLNFDQGKTSFVGEFDSGTTCLLLPNTEVKGNFTTSPFGILAKEQAQGKRHPLVYKTRDVDGNVRTYEMSYSECVEPTDETMILGDPWFRKFVVMHDLTDLDDRKMGLAPRSASYRLGATTDRSILTPGHEPHSLHQVSKVHAQRKVRDGAFTQALHETKKSMARASELHATSLVDKVAVKSQSMVTYNIQLAVGTPAQPLQVIFDTGSFMLAIFAEAPPKGMKPLLKETHKKKSEKKPAPSSVAAKVVAKVRKSLVSTADERGFEVLAQTRVIGGVAGGSGGWMGMAGGVFLACAVAVVGVAAAVRRRRRGGAGGLASDAGEYGAC